MNGLSFFDLDDCGKEDPKALVFLPSYLALILTDAWTFEQFLLMYRRKRWVKGLFCLLNSQQDWNLQSKARAIEKELDNLDNFWTIWTFFWQFGHFLTIWTFMDNLDIFGQFGHLWTIWTFMDNLDIFGHFGHFWKLDNLDILDNLNNLNVSDKRKKWQNGHNGHNWTNWTKWHKENRYVEARCDARA